VKLLLDTHAFVWRVTNPDLLSAATNELIDDRGNEVLVSAASAWEVATKTRLGKLPGGDQIVAGFAATIELLGAKELPIAVEHGVLAGTFDVDHRDPFDRMLAAQAAREGCILVTRDSAFEQFPVTTRW